jgi:hypothetical protein
MERMHWFRIAQEIPSRSAEMGCRRQRQIELAVGCTCTGSYFCLSSLPFLELARMMSKSLAVFCNEQMKFALVEDDPSFDLQEVASRTERNMRNCVRLAIEAFQE